MLRADEFCGLMNIQELRIGRCPVFLELLLLKISICSSGFILKVLSHYVFHLALTIIIRCGVYPEDRVSNPFKRVLMRPR
jgi:hypothetical protein